MSTAEFGEYIKTEIAKWGRVVKEGNIHAQYDEPQFRVSPPSKPLPPV